MNRLDNSYTDLIRDRLLELVRQPGKTVIFNLEGISDMEPGGFEALLEVEREASVHGSTFKLCNVTDELRELILLMELEGDFSFCAGENGEEKVLLELG